MHTAYVTSKGQLAIPVKLRRKFNIKKGTRINFAEVPEGILMRPVTREYIASFCGIFKPKAGDRSVVEEHLAERRAERDRENRQ